MNDLHDGPLRALVYGHVNLNVVDGSAFFVASLAAVLTSAGGVEVDVVTANPITRSLVVEEMIDRPGVSVIDPYHDLAVVGQEPEWRGRARMTPAEAAAVVLHYWARGRYDVLFVRGTEVGREIALAAPDVAAKLMLYVTGVVAASSVAAPETVTALALVAERGGTLVCQTPEMRDVVDDLMSTVGVAARIEVLQPAVPDEESSSLPGGSTLVVTYAGKFARDWNTLQMLSGFKEAQAQEDRLRLVVAGESFKQDPDRPSFGAEARYLLSSSPAITWLGGVPRARARAMIRGSDVGVSWRHSRLDDSLELSTKVLEYGMLGRPCILNRTAMHERVFGLEYPLYANTMLEFVELLVQAARDRGRIVAAAEIAARAARGHGYRRVLEQVFPAILKVADGGGSPASIGRSLHSQVDDLAAGRARLVRDDADGQFVGWLADPSDAARLFEVTGAGARLREFRRVGPLMVGRLGDAPVEPPARAAQLLEQVVDLLAQRPDATRPSSVDPDVERQVVHDIGGGVSLGGPVHPEPVTRAAPSTAALEGRISGLERDLATLRLRYDALGRSKLGSLQRRYWRLRSRLRRTP